MNIYAITDNYSLLRLIPHDFLEECLSKKTIKVRTYSKEEIVHFEGDVCTSIDIILSGQVVVERIDESGDLLTIAEFHPDDILGGNLVFSKNPYYPMTVTAKSATSLLVIQKDPLFELCSRDTEFMKAFFEYISDHALLLGDKIKHYVNRSIRESIVAFLKNENKLQSSHKILLRSTKKALADRIGVQRTSLSRELQKMKNEGLIEFDTVSITIVDLNLLK